MPLHMLKLLEKHEIARATFLFRFAKPAGFTFKPGQYGGFTLLNTDITEPGAATRRFSLLSSPDDATIDIATRMQPSAYKQHLNTLAIGAEIKFAGPTGAFTLHEDATVPAVFIAGGIGITPFYSMLRHAVQHHSAQPLFLFYGNQTVADAPLLRELTELKHPAFTFIPTLAHPDANWQRETGYITHTMIKKYIKDLNKPIFYVCGSPGMVTAMQELLVEMGIENERIKVEDFPGY